MRTNLISLLVFSLALACSKETPVAVPEPLYQGTPPGMETPPDGAVGGEDAEEGTPPVGGETPTETPPIDRPIDPPTTNPDDMPPVVIPEPQVGFYSEPHEVLGELMTTYNRDTGLWNEGWRASALSILSIADYMKKTKTLELIWVLDTTYRKNNFNKDNFEDNATWALAWLTAHDVTKEARYLDIAKSLYGQLAGLAYDTVCDGGLYEAKDKLNKSAMVNLLFIELSARLYEYIPTEKIYHDNAVSVWDWIKTSPLIADSLVHNSIKASDCSRLPTVTKSAPQGLVLSALSSFYRTTQDMKYLTEAGAYFEASRKEFVNGNSIIHEKNLEDCSACPSNDASSKGLYAYGLGSYHQSANSDLIATVLKSTTENAWANSKGTGGAIGYNWSKPYDTTTNSRQIAAALLFNTRITKAFDSNVAFRGDTRTSAICGTSEPAANAFDGSGGTKWCGGMTNGVNHLSVDVGGQRNLKTVRILHAGAGGESKTLNTKDFDLQISSNGSDFTTISMIRGNASSITVHRVSATGRYLRLRFINPGADNTGRIYEMMAD